MTDPDTGSDPAPSPPPGRRASVLALWLSEASRARMARTFLCDVGDDVERAGVADLVVLSTRTPAARMARIMAILRDEADCPVVALCHAGGEATAVELVELGATCVVAEGNEATLHRLVPAAGVVGEAGGPAEGGEDAGGPAETLVTTYAQRLDEAVPGSDRALGRDEVSGLPGPAAFELRMAELAQRSTLPHLGVVRLANPATTTRGLDREALDLLRRRLAMLFNTTANRYDAELFSLGDVEFAFVARGLTDRRAAELGGHMVAVAETFSPLGVDPMRLAVGHAGPEVAADLRTLRELAEGAATAAVAAGGGVVSADELGREQASSTELEAALRLAARVDEIDPYVPGHSARVAEHAVRIAREMGIDGHDLIRLRLAAVLHDIGKLGLSPAALDAPERLTGAAEEEWGRHPGRGDAHAGLSGGAEVSAAVRHHHERWDGGGIPDGLGEEEIPLAARIIAVADAYDRWTAGPEQLDPPAALSRLVSQSGTAFDPTLVATAVDVLAPVPT